MLYWKWSKFHLRPHLGFSSDIITQTLSNTELDGTSQKWEKVTNWRKKQQELKSFKKRLFAIYWRPWVRFFIEFIIGSLSDLSALYDYITKTIKNSIVEKMREKCWSHIKNFVVKKFFLNFLASEFFWDNSSKKPTKTNEILVPWIFLEKNLSIKANKFNSFQRNSLNML